MHGVIALFVNRAHFISGIVPNVTNEYLMEQGLTVYILGIGINGHNPNKERILVRDVHAGFR